MTTTSQKEACGNKLEKENAGVTMSRSLLTRTKPTAYGWITVTKTKRRAAFATRRSKVVSGLSSLKRMASAHAIQGH